MTAILFKFYPELIESIAVATHPIWKNFLPRLSQNSIADVLHKKYIDNVQNNFIETKPRLRKGEVFDKAFEDKLNNLLDKD